MGIVWRTGEELREVRRKRSTTRVCIINFLLIKTTLMGRYGDCLANGTGIAKNVKEALKYWKLAADQGDDAGRAVTQGWFGLTESVTWPALKR
jgi:hypothetical protein